MPAKEVWGDFKRLEDRHGPAKQNYEGTFIYAQWACPHCDDIVETRAAGAIDRKADVCKDHFWGRKPCEKRPPEDVRGKPKGPTAAATASMEAVLREQLEQTKAQMKQASDQHAASMEQAAKQHAEAMAMQQQTSKQHAETMAIQVSKQHTEAMDMQAKQLDALRQHERHLASIRDVQRMAVCTALGLSDHSSDDDDGVKIAVRTKRRLAEMQAMATDTATLGAFETVARAGSFSPPRDDEPPIAVGKRVANCVSVMAADASSVPGLRCQLAAVNTEVGLAEGAPPADRVNAIRALKSDVDKARGDAEHQFDSVSNAAGRKHVSAQDQVDHVEALSKAATVAQMGASAGSRATNVAHIRRIDTILNLGDRLSQVVRETEISRLKRAASSSQTTQVTADVKIHLGNLDRLLGFNNEHKLVSNKGREATLGRLAESAKPIQFSSKIKKKLLIALSEDHLQDANDLESARGARTKLGM